MNSYENCFEVVPAETAEQLASTFRLRYQVYCVENAFEEPNPLGLECDRHDAVAVHSLLLDRATKLVLGSVRLVLPQPGAKSMGLPIREICDDALVARDNPILPWASTAEISRFAISKKMLKHARDRSVASAQFVAGDGDHVRRHMTEPSLGLMQAAMAMALKNGITHVCAVMEPALLRMVRRLGMDFLSVGPAVSYHGLRQPCYLHIESALRRAWLMRRDLWAFMTREGSLWPLSSDHAAWPPAARTFVPAELRENVALKYS